MLSEGLARFSVAVAQNQLMSISVYELRNKIRKNLKIFMKIGHLSTITAHLETFHPCHVSLEIPLEQYLKVLTGIS